MTPREIVYIALGVLLLTQLLISGWGWRQLKVFLNEHPSLASTADFEEFKRVVRGNMYMAVSIVGLMLAVIIVVVAGFLFGGFSLLELILLSMVVAGLFSVSGVAISALEKRMKSLPLEGSIPQDEYDRIVKAWTDDMLPDW